MILSVPLGAMSGLWKEGDFFLLTFGSELDIIILESSFSETVARVSPYAVLGFGLSFTISSSWLLLVLLIIPLSIAFNLGGYGRKGIFFC